MPREVLAVRCGSRAAARAQSFLNYHLYSEPDAMTDVDYFFWVVRDTGSGAVVLVDTGFAPDVGQRRGREGGLTPAEALPALGADPRSVTTVVVTHAHWDHIGNLRQFPDAEIIMTAAEYDFWTSPLAGRLHFAAYAEAGELAHLAEARKQGRLTLFSGTRAAAPGVDLVEVGGHTPGQLIALVAGEAGKIVLTSDSMHLYEEVERDRPYAIVADLPGMYRTYDLLAELASEPGTRLVAGHDPQVRNRFQPHAAHPAVTDLTAALS